MVKYKYTKLKEIHWEDTDYILNKPIPISLNKSEFDGLWIASNRGTNVWAYGETKEIALKQFQYYFDVTWKEFVEKDAGFIFEKNEKIKNLMLGYVKEKRRKK